MSDATAGDNGANVLVRHSEGDWHEPEVRGYRLEEHLERVLLERPDLMPGVPPGSVAVRQLQVPATGPADLIVVSATGEITLCECKLARNPEIRREIIGQVFAYASGLWKLTYDRFDELWRARSDGTPLAASLNIDEESAEDFRAAVARDLALGRFRLILAVDAITPELRRIVEYLNAHTVADMSVIALELAYGGEQGVEILLPRVFGVELADAKRRAATPASNWTEDDLLDWIAAHQPDVASPVRELLDRFRPKVAYYFYGEAKTPSATAIITDPVECQPFTVATGVSGWVGLTVNFAWMHRLGDPVVAALLDRLMLIEEIRPLLEGIAETGYRKRTTIRWPDLAAVGVLDAISAALEEAVSNHPQSGSRPEPA